MESGNVELMAATVDDNLIGCRRRISDFRRLGALGVLGGETPSPRSPSFIQSAVSALSADNIVSSSSSYMTSSSNQPAATYTFNLGNSGSSAYQTPLASYSSPASSSIGLPPVNMNTTDSFGQVLNATMNYQPDIYDQMFNSVYSLGNAAVNAANYVGTAYNDWQQNAPVKPAWLTEMEKSPAFMLVNPEGDIGAVGEEALVTAKNLLQGTENATNAGAKFGNALSTDYRATFFAAHPELEGQVIVHHAVEQQVLTKFPGVLTEAEIHSLENLRGIPNGINSEVHLSQIRIDWNNFYEQFSLNGMVPTKSQLLQKATQIDAKYGLMFTPPIGNK